MFCWGVADWSEQRHLPRTVLPVASVAALVLLSIVSYCQISYWSDDITLWIHCTEVTQNNLKAEFYLGLALLNVERRDEAAQHFLKAESYNEGDADTNLQLAFYEHQRGNLPQAIEYYKTAKAITENPALKRQILANMASAYRALGDYAAADQCLQSAAQAVPANAVDWQGKWWTNIVPMIREYFHGGASKPSKD
jgi:tetratricopeptide (TPR) repeat protein